MSLALAQGSVRGRQAPSAVAQVFIREGIAIGLMSWLLGSLLAIPMTHGLNQVVGTAIIRTPSKILVMVPGLARGSGSTPPLLGSQSPI